MRLLPNLGARDAGQRGQTTTEFVIVFPMLILLFFLMLEFGWLLKNWIVVTNAAREATRCAIAQSCQVNGTPTDPKTLIFSRLGSGITGNLDVNRDGKLDATDVKIDIEVVDQDGDNAPSAGDSLVVCIEAGNKPITPAPVFLSAGTLPDPLPLAAREEMLIEFGLPANWSNWATMSNDGGECDFN